MAKAKSSAVVHPAMFWAKRVLAGKQVAGRLITLAVQRHMHDLALTRRKGGHPKGFVFDEEKAGRVIRFFERNLRHWKGEWAGQALKLQPWQQFVLWVIFGWRRADGMRRFRRVWLEVGRKNGKTLLAAGLGLYLMDPDGEPGAEIFSTATKLSQVSRYVMRDAWEMSRQSDLLRDRIECTRTIEGGPVHLVCEARKSTFTALSSESSTFDALNVHGAILDEMHEHRTLTAYEKLETGMGARRQPLLIVVTTAGDDTPETPYAQLHDYAVNVLEGYASGFDDDALAVFIFALDEDDDPFDADVWEKANPNIGVSVKREYLAEQAQKAQNDGAFMPSYLRYHCNRRAAAAARAIAPEDWDACAEAIDWSEYDGATCYGGIDLSSTQDLTSVALCFVRKDGGIVYRWWNFLPIELLAENSRRDLVPYADWAAQGHLLTTPGNQIDDRAIAALVLELSERYQVVQWAVDPWHAVQLANRLQEVGITVVKFTQDLPSFGAPVMHFLDEVRAGAMRHDGNPLVRWCALNAVTKEDAHGNRKFHKAASRKRIDPIVAATMARGRALVLDTGAAVVALYESEGLTVL